MKIDGLPVVEAKTPITLHISKRDVSLAKTKDPGSCAAARCCLRRPEVKAARVHAGRTYLQIGKVWYRYKTSPGLRQEIVTFDRGGTFAPGEYDLKPLSEWERANGRRQGSSAKGARDAGSKNRAPKKPRRKYHKVTGIRSSAVEYAE